jgi:Uncharacterized conserved protein (COG2071)
MYQQFLKQWKACFTKSSTSFLEWTLLFSFCIHGIAMLTMLFFLLPGLPGGPNDSMARMTYVASAPWLWRLGWFPWQLTALSDLLISLALLRMRWRLVALLSVLFVGIGIVPDQMGQILWMTRGVALAQQGTLALYSQFEATVFFWIGVYGGTCYTLTAIGWTWYFATQGKWQWARGLTIYSVALWGLFLFLSSNPLLPSLLHLSTLWIAAGNALGFVLLLTWFALVAELVMRQTRPDQAVGRNAPWHHPRAGLGRIFDLIGNSRFVRSLCEYVPTVAFLSDITDVIYVNYIVEASKLEPLVPTGLELQRLGANGRYAMFTFLTFKHGHFGPRLLGKARKFFPSPVQTNWRIYVRDPRTKMQGVFFVSNASDSTLVALGARLLAEGMPMHVLLARGIYTDKDGKVSLYLDSGKGSAPDAQAILQCQDERPAQGPWSLCFTSYKEMLAYCVPQDRAFSSQPWYSRLTRQEIRLDIPLDACKPLEGIVYSRTARKFVGDATPFCFLVANVNFRFEQEIYARL